MFLALAIAAICGPARGHQAPSGWEYPLACCAQRDCARVPPPQVTPAGLVFRLGPGDHPMVLAPITITLPGAGTRTWANPGTGAFIRANGSNTGFAYEDSARAWVDLGANKDYQATLDFTMSSACNIVIGGLKTDGAGGWNAALVALLVGLTDLRIRQYDAGGTPTDVATATLSAGGLSTGTGYKLQFVRRGNIWAANVLTAAGALRDALPYTAGTAPTGNFWGFGFLNGGVTATFDNFLVEDAPAASAVWANCANV